MAKGSLRLLAYARVSDVRGREGPGFISEADQHARCRAYADAYGHTIIEEGSDLDVSGGLMSRPTFDRFLTKVKDGQVDGIIVAKLDRFARSASGALDAVKAIEHAGGALISVAEQIDSSTSGGKFIRAIFFAAAEWEKDRIGEAWFAARSSAVDRGIHVSRYVPPGYKRSAKTNDPATDRRLVLDGAKAEAVREAFRMAARGESNSTIAAHLTHSLGNGYWTSYRVPRLLANRVYLGEARSGKGVAVNRGAHDPLIDEQTFLLAQRQRAESLSRAGESVSLLSGIVRCAGCSFAMKPQSESKNAKAIYRCVRESVHGVCAEPSAVAKERIEDFVVRQFLEHYSGEYAPAEHADGPGLKDAVEAERAYRAQLDNLELRGTIGDADHDRLIANLYRQWQEKLAAAADTGPVGPPSLGTVALNELVGELREQGLTADLRELLASGIEAVFVRRAASRSKTLPIADRVKIVWRGERVELPRRGHRFEPRKVTW